MNNREKGKTNLVDWFKGLSPWNKLACVIFGLTCIATVWLIGTVISLNMLPMHYVAVIILLVVLFLFGTFKALFVSGFAKKNGKNKKKNKKNQNRTVLIRLLGLVLALSIVLVDAVGINVLSQLQGTLTDISGDSGEVAYEIVGVYVLAEDSAEELKDVTAYDFGYSLAYDTDSMETAINMLEEAVDKSMSMDEFDSDIEAVDALLGGSVDAILLNAAYVSVLEGQDGYTDINTRIKLVHEFKMEDDDAVSLNLDTKPKDLTKEPFIVYISGNDTNYSLKNCRSDVNILAVVNPVTKQVLLINTPRDYYVELVGSGKGDGQMDKLTHCGIYGLECSMLTLGDLYDQDIHFYAQVNFSGFVKMIDALGGINVYSDATFYAAESGTQIYKGENYLTGKEALGFVRERHNLADGDNARGRHQMAVIKAIIKKAASSAIITNYSKVLDSMGDCFGTNLTNDEMSSLVKMQLSDMASWNIQSFSVIGQGNGGSDYVYSISGQKAYVMYQNEAYVEHAQNLIDKVFAGETITEEDLVVPTE